MGGTKAQRGAEGPDPIASETMAQLEANHWRDLATERDAALRSLTRRPLVRLATRLDRRLSPPAQHVGDLVAALRPAVDRAAVRAAAARARPRRTSRRARLARTIGQLGPAPSPPDVALVALDAGGHPAPTVGEQARAAASGTVVCFVPASLESPDPHWLARLTAVIGDGVVAATPTLVRSARTPADLTEHELLVSSEGFAVELDASGAPAIVARAAGADASVDRAPSEVTAAPLLGLAVDRDALLAAGGLAGGLDGDESGIDLCARLRRAGGEIRHVPDAIVFDDRPVASRRSLQRPLPSGGAGWLTLVDEHGPALVRSVLPPEHPTRWVITTAVPSARMAERWGDWHLAEALARALRRLGEDVVVQPLDRADEPATRSRDVHLVLHGLAPVRRSRGQRHVLWVISHPETLDAAECDAADLILVASSRFAAEVRGWTSTPVEVLLQATDRDRFYPRRSQPEHEHEVTIVAKTRGVPRKIVSDALAAGLRPAIYGGGWRDLVDPDLIVADHVDNALLPVVYSSAGVVLNDHWNTMRGWGFVSNRIFDVLACGAPIVSDAMPEIHELFGDAVATYDDPDALAKAVGAMLDDPAGARQTAAAGRQIVLGNHTFDHRARELLELVATNPRDGRKTSDD